MMRRDEGRRGVTATWSYVGGGGGTPAGLNVRGHRAESSVVDWTVAGVGEVFSMVGDTKEWLRASFVLAG